MTSISILPMYDWPEVRSYTDSYYECLKGHLSDLDLPVPDKLMHDADGLIDIWKSPDLLIGQTCGLPFMRFLQGEVTHLGSPAYQNGSQAGYYSSVIIARDDHSLDDLYKMKFGCNELGSQSGYACLQNHFKENGFNYLDPQSITLTGNHRNSIKAVQAGEIDYAAIDNVSWGLALKHEAATEGLKVISNTGERPTLPYITSTKYQDMSDKLGLAIQEAIKNLDQDIKDNLLLSGFILNTENKYNIIKENYQALEASTNRAKT